MTLSIPFKVSLQNSSFPVVLEGAKRRKDGPSVPRNRKKNDCFAVYFKVEIIIIVWFQKISKPT